MTKPHFLMLIFPYRPSMRRLVLIVLLIPGYKHFKGQVLNASELRELFDGLKLNDIHHYSHLLTGKCNNDHMGGFMEY
jgi:hypothetical protein